MVLLHSASKKSEKVLVSLVLFFFLIIYFAVLSLGPVVQNLYRVIHKYADFCFGWKNVSSFSHFFRKNIRILYIESAKTVNEMTLNELVS